LLIDQDSEASATSRNLDHHLHLVALRIEQRVEPVSTIASGSIRPVMIFSAGRLPLEIIRITRDHIVIS
jgi:hypothetical protein